MTRASNTSNRFVLFVDMLGFAALVKRHRHLIAALEPSLRSLSTVDFLKQEQAKFATAIAKIEKQRQKVAAKIAERDERIAEAQRQARDDRENVSTVGDDLLALYSNPQELLKHARVVDVDEIQENEFNLNIPRYVDTFEPERRVEVKDALKALRDAQGAERQAGAELTRLLSEVGYAD